MFTSILNFHHKVVMASSLAVDSEGKNELGQNFSVDFSSSCISGIRYMPLDYIRSTRFKGKNALVTAGTKGIGRAIVQRLANDGCRVYICSRKQKNVTALVNSCVAEGLDVGGTPCNVTKECDLENFITRAREFFRDEPLHFVVSNVGVNPVMGTTRDICIQCSWLSFS